MYNINRKYHPADSPEDSFLDKYDGLLLILAVIAVVMILAGISYYTQAYGG